MSSIRPNKPASSPAPLDAQMSFDAETAPLTIAADHSCVGCGYNLRGLPVDGRCPECGNTVTASFLATSGFERAWVEDLRDGAGLIVTAYGTLFTSVCLFAVLLLVVLPLDADALFLFTGLAAAISLLVAAGVADRGLMIVCGRTSARLESQEPLRRRVIFAARALRATVALALVLFLLLEASFSPFLMVLLALVAAAAALLWFFVRVTYFRYLAYTVAALKNESRAARANGIERVSSGFGTLSAILAALLLIYVASHVVAPDRRQLSVDLMPATLLVAMIGPGLCVIFTGLPSVGVHMELRRAAIAALFVDPYGID